MLVLLLSALHYGLTGAGLDKIKTFCDRSLNFTKLSVKVHKLRQQNLQQKVQNLWNQESLIIFILFLALKFLLP